MKKTAALLLAMCLLSPAFYAAAENAGQNGSMAGQQDDSSGSGMGQGVQDMQQNRTPVQNTTAAQDRNQTRNQTYDADQARNQSRDQLMNQSANAPAANQTRQQTRNATQDIEELRDRIRNQSRILNQSLQNVPAGQQQIYRDQNEVRVAVQALIGAENLSGGIGRNVSAIAREFNNSIQATIQTEERIQARSGIMRFFFGGDEQATAELERQIIRNRDRIHALTQYMNECDCDPEIRLLLQEQIQNMEQEQNRLQALVQQDSADKGILGWLFK